MTLQTYAKVVCGLLLLAATGTSAADGYPLTKEALQQRYVDEVRAHTKYLSYARQACTEGYPNIAHLFLSLGASEAVHARNFQGLLLELGMKPKTPSMKLGGGAHRRRPAAGAADDRHLHPLLHAVMDVRRRDAPARQVA